MEDVFPIVNMEQAVHNHNSATFNFVVIRMLQCSEQLEKFVCRLYAATDSQNCRFPVRRFT